MLNQWTVDLKERLLVLTDDPDNKDLHRIVIRANTHKRARLDNSRFSSSITVDLPFRDMTDIEHNGEKKVNMLRIGLEVNGSIATTGQIATGWDEFNDKDNIEVD